MNGSKRRIGCIALGVAAWSAAPAAAQTWVLDVPGAAGDTNQEAEVIVDLEVDEAGLVYAVGARLEGSTDSPGYVMRTDLGVNGVDGFRYYGPGDLNLNLHDVTVIEGQQLLVSGASWFEGAAYPYAAQYDGTSGAVIWESSPTADRGVFRQIVPVPGGSIAIGPGYNDQTAWSLLVAKHDPQGNLLWQREFQDQGGSNIYPDDLEATHGGGVLVSGRVGEASFIVELNPDGTVFESRVHDFPRVARNGQLARTDDGGLFVATAHRDPGAPTIQPWIARMNPDGSVRWSNRYRTASGVLDEIHATSDGGCLLIGTAYLASQTRPSTLKLDADGNVEWRYTYDPLGADEDLVQVMGALLPDGGFLMGMRVSGPGFDSNAALMRIGPDGGLDGACAAFANEHEVSVQALDIPLVDWPLDANEPSPAVESFSSTLSHFALESQFECGESCPMPAPYCELSPNSVGPGGAIASLGSTSLAANDFMLTATALPPNTPGLFFFGQAPTHLPFMDGVLCVAGPHHRLGSITASVPGDAWLALDVTDLSSPASQFTPGSRWYCQLWYRDLAGGPAGSNLTNGLEVSFCP